MSARVISRVWISRACRTLLYGGIALIVTVGTTRAGAIDEQFARWKANYDPNDVVAQVLNYSEFGKDEGFDRMDTTSKIPFIYWYRDKVSKCTYRKAVNPYEGSIEESTINLDELDPKLIKFKNLNTVVGSSTMVMHDREMIFDSYGLLDLDRLGRGWSLIYSKYCSGTRKAF